MGTVQVVSTNTKVAAGSGAYVLLKSDTFTVTDCPFQIPAPSGTVPSPCVRVQWTVSDMKVKVGQVETLSEGSVGICYSAQNVPQGKVVVMNTQMKASSQ